MSPIEFYPKSLNIALSRPKVRSGEAKIYCKDCPGNCKNEVFGTKIDSCDLKEALSLAKDHEKKNPDHRITIVDQSNCNFGL